MSGNVLSKDDNFVPIEKEGKLKLIEEMLQNLLYFIHKKIHIVGVCFSFRVLHF